LSETEAIITDGEVLPYIDYSGDVLLAKLHAQPAPAKMSEELVFAQSV